MGGRFRTPESPFTNYRDSAHKLHGGAHQRSLAVCTDIVRCVILWPADITDACLGFTITTWSVGWDTSASSQVQ